MKSTKPVKKEPHHSVTSHKTLLSVLTVAVGLLVAGSAQAASDSTKISSLPYTITSPGRYLVTQDLTCAGTAITIAANKVELNLGGHTLSGDGSENGIFVQRGANVNIHHGTVQNFRLGIYLFYTLDNKLNELTLKQNDTGILGEHAIGTTVTDNTASRNGTLGILFHVNSRGNNVARNTASLNGSAGIVIAAGAFDNTVTANTANQNGSAGIGLGDAVANTVTSNTANDNGDRGINLSNASGNTVSRNTTDRNFAGINLDFDSQGNRIVGNSATANRGEGVRLIVGPTRNIIQDNTIRENNRGIWLGLGGANENTIQDNTATRNVLGILVEQDCTGNNLQGNTALTNRAFDLEDDNFGCDSNAWTDNKFVKDLVAGASDDGPGAGCLQ